MKKISFPTAHFMSFLARAGWFLVKSHIFTVWLGLGALGFWVGAVSRLDPAEIPYDDLFDNLKVLSYREAPSDTTVHFVVELSARGRVFRQYDIDAKAFQPPARSHDYWRSISGTRYAPLKVRGHVNRGFWLELPDSTRHALLPDQFDELYSTTIDFVKPVSLITTVVGVLSGYSVGYRLATWGHSISNPHVQERLLSRPDMGRIVAREAWRRVALEPVLVYAENDAGRFASVDGRQRLYTSFFRVATRDTNGFIPYESARLETVGHWREAKAMRAFARAVHCAASDTSDLTSADFSAVEDWASLLDRKGHWASGAWPPPGEERLRYLGTLAWYGLAPDSPDRRRIWIGPRLLVKDGDTEAFIADDVPAMQEACPVAWREWLGPDESALSAHAWTAQWMGDARPFAPVIRYVMGASSAAKKAAKERALASAERKKEKESIVVPQLTVTPRAASTAAAPSLTRAHADSSHADSALATGRVPESTGEKPDSAVLRASFGTLGR